jgi:HEAT repeat protein
MHWQRVRVALSVIISAVLASSALAQHAANDEAYLAAAKISPDAKGLLEFFRSRSLRGEQLGQVEQYLEDLADARFKVREAASEKLIQLGIPVLPALRRFAHDADPERGRRAQACIAEIELHRVGSVGLAMPAARVLAKLKPPGAMEALLIFLPFNEDEWVEEEVLTALTDLVRDGRPLDPVIVGFLSDQHPARRAASGLLAGRSSEPEHRLAVQKLLHDTNPKVQLRAAQGLLAGHDREAVPALIRLVEHGPTGISSRAEETLFRMAGDKAPGLSSSTSLSSQRRNAQAWTEWWRQNASQFDLRHWEDESRDQGLTLVAEMDSNQVWEYAADGAVKWKIKDLSGPMDAHILRNGHVLIAEYEGRRVTERDLKGKILWSKSLSGNPIACQRLNNGNTFIATHHSLVEVTPAGAEVYNHTPSKSIFLFGAQKLANGHVVYIANPGIIEEFDPVKEQIIRNVRLGSDFGGWCSVEVLANGRFLVALFTEGKVQELDAAGKILWQCRVAGACHASRLRNGNTLVASMTHRKVLELDGDGKIIHEYGTEGRPWRVHHR